MRKVTLLLAFTLTLMLGAASCSHPPPGPSPDCSACGFTPFAPLFFSFPNGLRTQARADVLGCILYFSQSGSCGTVVQGIDLGFNLTASPSSIDLNSPPSTATITGQSMSSTYGMPRVDYFDGYGYLIGSTTATYVSGDGTQLQAPVPSLSYAWSGDYLIVVTNMESNGFYAETVGRASISCWGRDRPDSDGDGYYDDEDCYPWDYTRWDCNDPEGCGNEGPHSQIGRAHV